MIIAIRHFPDRKNPCLVVEEGNHGLIVANFKGEKHAQLVQNLLGENVALKVRSDSSLDDLIAWMGGRE